MALAGQSFILDACHHAPLATYPGAHAGHVSPPLMGGSLPYLALLQVGFTLPPALAGAVRSYRTFSPLPPRPAGPLPAARRGLAVFSLWHFP
ncbi:hypothetical protein BH18PSE1_BH18PSE1_00950 [soil metagenome]